MPQISVLLATHKPRVSVHFAAKSHIDRSVHGLDESIRANINDAISLLEAARAYWSALPKGLKVEFRFLHV